MSGVEPLVCPRCGAPLPSDLLATPRCGYCGVGILMRGGAIEATAGAPGAPLQGEVDHHAFMEAVTTAVKSREPACDAIRRAAAAHLGVLGESDAIGRVTLAIARDFDREHPGAEIENDGVALSRIAEGYLKALPSLRESGKATMLLPFLGVTSEGPVHFETTLSPASIATLLQRSAEGRRPAPAPAPEARSRTEASTREPETAAPAPKKRGWWPFGG